MIVKNLKELRELCEAVGDHVHLRENGKSKDGSFIDILIGMGTCGLAAGALETFEQLEIVLKKKGLNHVNVISVGCVGFCHMEPTVQVNIPGKEPVIYGRITHDQVEKLVNKVIIDGGFLQENYLIKSFRRAVI